MRLIIAIICFVSMAFCPNTDTDKIKDLKTLPKEVKQVIMVQDHKLSLWNRTDLSWEMAFEVPCHYGKNGLSADRHDGDGTTGSGNVLHANTEDILLVLRKGGLQYLGGSGTRFKGDEKKRISV